MQLPLSVYKSYRRQTRGATRVLSPAQAKGRIYISDSYFRNRQIQEFSDSPGTLCNRVFGWGSLVPLSVIISGLEDAGFSRQTPDHAIPDWMHNIERNRASLEAIHPGIADESTAVSRDSNLGWVSQASIMQSSPLRNVRLSDKKWGAGYETQLKYLN